MSIIVAPKTVIFPNTFITSTTMFTVTITNTSDNKIIVDWRKYSTKKEETKAINQQNADENDQRMKLNKLSLFSSSAFQFVNENVEIWPHESKQVIVSFSPEIAQLYSETAYININNFEAERIPIFLQGIGLPPKAIFPISSISVGHVNLDTILEYKVTMENVGQVGVDFSLETKYRGNLVFEFTPSSGHIDVGGSMDIRIKFIANNVETFAENFQFSIKGAPFEHPTISLFGKVIGPKIDISTKVIDFGTVSCGFSYSRSFEIENKSNVVFNYNLALEGSKNFSMREFAINPQHGTVKGFAKETITVEFIPSEIQEYNANLFLNIDKFQDGCTKIPIIAESIIPPVSFVSNTIDLHNVFIGSKINSCVQLKNDNDLPAWFEYIDSSESTKLIADVTVPRYNLVVEPHKTSNFEFSIKPLQLGPFSISQYLKLKCGNSKPISFIVSGVCTGPNITMSASSIDFGSIQVLKEASSSFTIKNDSTISTGFRTDIISEFSVFSLSEKEGTLEAGETRTFYIKAVLDDTSAFTGKLCFIFDHLNPKIITLSAKGTGTTIESDIQLSSNVDCRYMYTDARNVKTIVLTNRGRKQQEVIWSYGKPRFDCKNVQNFQFWVEPENACIPSNESQAFNFVMLSNRPIKFQVDLHAYSIMRKQRVCIYEPIMQGTFIRPAISFSSQSLIFKHIHDYEKEEKILNENGNAVPTKDLLEDITQELTVTNKAALPITMSIGCPNPFSTQISTLHLDPNESKTIEVTFSPKFKTDFSQETVNRNLSFILEEAQKNLTVALSGVIVFPNLTFEPKGPINFGSLLMNTEQTKDLVLKNTSELPCNIEWKLLPVGETENISKVFDIYPIRATVLPGNEGIAHISLFSLCEGQKSNIEYECKAICHVEGGPEYCIYIRGGSANITYTIDPLHVTFKDKCYLDDLKQTILFSNTSEVPINFNIKVPKATKFKNVTFSPLEGQVEAGKSLPIQMNITTGLPIEYSETFFFQIGHYDEQRFDIEASCGIPQVQIDLPRSEDDPIIELINKKKCKDPTQETYVSLETEYALNYLSTLNQITSVRRKRKDTTKFDNCVISRYDYNLGTIVFGTNETYNLPVKNISKFPISFIVDPQEMNDSCFSVDVTQFQKVNPGDTVNIPIKFETKKKANDGQVSYCLPIILSKDFAVFVNVQAELMIPTINLSNTRFNYDNVFIGQTLVMTLQLQNMNTVPCMFSFGDTQSSGVDTKNVTDVSSIYTISSLSGTLPPSSFINVEIAFTPKAEKNYLMNVPIRVRYNPNPYIITLNGTGILLKVLFDPPSIAFPPIQPFSDSAIMEVKLKNPTNYPIEVFSLQYDMQLLYNYYERTKLAEAKQTSRKSLTSQCSNTQQEENEDVSQEVSTFSNNNIAKFSLCVIVTGVTGSGKTTVSTEIANYLHVPILYLKEVWGNLPANSSDDDYVSSLKETINMQKFASGFVVDGLNYFPEPDDNTSFVKHCMKTKNILDDLSKNPWMTFPRTNVSANERALDYLLRALDGHYVFHIALQASIDQMTERNDMLERLESKKNKLEQQKEKEELFNMTEEQYNELDDEEQQIIDAKRNSFRKRLVKSALSSIDNEETSRETSRRHRHSSRSKDKKTSKESSGDKESSRRHKNNSKDKDNSKDKEKEKEKKTSKENDDNKVDKKQNLQEILAKKKSSFPTDPLHVEILAYNFNIGVLAQKLREKTETFTVVDPIQLLRVQSDLSSNTLNAYVTQQGESKVQSLDVQTQMNTIIIPINNSKESVNMEAIKFIPLANQLKNRAFTCLIPEPKLIAHDTKNDKSMQLLPAPDYFSIDLTDNDMAKIKAFIDSKASNNKGGRSSRSQKDRNIIPDDIDTSKNTPHWDIPANSDITLNVSFNAKKLGSYSDVLLFSLTNGRNDVFKLPVSGSCEYPDFERNTRATFPKRDVNEQNKYSRENNEYNFGTLLVSKDKSPKTSSYKGSMKISNNSRFPLEVAAFLNDLSATNAFVIEQPNFVVEQNEAHELVFYFVPSSPGIHKARVDVSIKDNPVPYSFFVAGESCFPSIDLSCTTFNYEKILVAQTKVLKMMLQNNGMIPAYWRLKNQNVLSSDFSFNKQEGLIAPMSSFALTLTFSSKAPCIVKKAIQIEVLDKNQAKVYHSQAIQVLAEAFNVISDFQFPKNMDHLDFGSMKVGTPKTLSCTLANKGKYQCAFNVQIKLRTISSIFQVTPNKGQIPPGKSVTICFTFMANRVVTYDKMKEIVLNLIDCNTGTATEALSLPFSAKTLFSAFTFDVPKVLDFGSIQVLSNANKKFFIKNTGIFPFEYDIAAGAEANNELKDKKKSPKQLKKKVNDKAVRVGPFSIYPSSGSIDPNNTATIDVDFTSAETGQFNGTAIVSIKDANPFRGGDKYTLQLSGATVIPGINTTSFDKIFAGLHLCLLYEKKKVKTNAFIEDERTLQFAPIILQNKSTVSCSLINDRNIPCIVDISLKAKGKQTPQFPFEISTKSVTIPPLSSVPLSITFAPTVSDKFIGLFEANVRSSTDNEAKQLKFNVEGTGALPMVSLIGFDKPSKSNTYTINMRRSLIGYDSDKVICMRNDCAIPAVLGIKAKQNPDFEIVDFDSLANVTIEPGRDVSLTVIFHPQTVKKSTFEISVTVDDNPKGNFNINVIAESFKEDIIFENVRNEDELVFSDCIVGRRQQAKFLMKNVSHNDIRFNWQALPEFSFSPKVGHLRFGKAKEISVTYFPEKQEKLNAVKVSCQWNPIKLINKIAPDWDDTMKVTKFVNRPKTSQDIERKEDSPSHQAGNEKQIQSKFMKKDKRGSTSSKIRRSALDKQILPKQTGLTKTQEANQEKTETNHLPPLKKSDEPMELVKVTDVKPEPINEIIPGKYKDLQIKIFTVSDTIKFNCDTTEILFSPTMMYQSRTAECKITNPSSIRFEYTWYVLNFESLRTDYALTRKPPFTVMPTTGFIEPNQTKVFKVCFKPEEVDDFTAVLQCQIPFIQVPPPTINVSGISKRPLCHFNLVLSDYLTGNKRHPDYTYQLPKETKVFEIYASKPGQKVTSKFEIINPTSFAYEIVISRQKGPDPAVSSVINCDTPAALVSSGKKYSVVFSYTPTTQKLIESLWEFSIPDQNVHFDILVVGRIVTQ